MKQGCGRLVCRSIASEPALSLGHAELGKKQLSLPVTDNAKPFNCIPGPKPSLPLIGTSWQYFRWGRYNLFKLHEACIDKYHRYGDIMKEEYQWHTPVVHAFNPDDFETVFRHQGRCPVRPPNAFVSKYRREHADRYDSVGLSNALGEEWYNLRSALAPVLLQMKNVQTLCTQQEAISEDFATYLRGLRNPQDYSVSNIQDPLYRLTLESIFMLCLNSRLGCLSENDTKDATTVIAAAKSLFSAYQKLYYGLPLWKYFTTSAYREYQNAEETLYDVTLRYLEECGHHMSPQVDNSEPTLLQALLGAEGLSKKDRHLTIMDFIAGGVFTATNSLCFLLHHLACNPGTQEKLYRELETAGWKATQCSYLRACIKESFRLSPTVPGVMRILPEAVTLSGYNVPAGVPIFANFLVPCSLDKYFPGASVFRPERWIGPERASIHPFSMLPFGHGARMCAGRRFAELELMTATAKVVQHFILEPVTTALELNYIFLMAPSHPVGIKFHDRSSQRHSIHN
ncbi:ecdysone 20-monooxygenase-like [Ornithodoros turicata]|uniref:ecdysone 20-monooxygenase-like n=1 Tax=Ornithodoros turicata TaxID=34597 RepID=UPI00313900D3